MFSHRAVVCPLLHPGHGEGGLNGERCVCARECEDFCECMLRKVNMFSLTMNSLLIFTCWISSSQLCAQRSSQWMRLCLGERRNHDQVCNVKVIRLFGTCTRLIVVTSALTLYQAEV